MATNFHLAPPPKTVDGLLAVPIDIQSITATIVFDGNTQAGTVDATIQYTVGPANGNPIFDCRQTITQAWLDGAVFPIAQLALHNFGAGAFSELRIIESVQNAGTVHTLRVQYNLGVPQSQIGGYNPIFEWLAGPKLHFRFGFTDRRAGCYLEAWLPANLIFDQYSIDLDIQITNAAAAHSVITNGALTNIGSNHWSVHFPQHFSALSPLLEIHATDRLDVMSDTVSLPVSGKVVTIDAFKLTTTTTTNLTTQINNIKTFLTDNENNYGSYLHGNRFVAFFNGGGMEYEGGTTTGTGPLKHETFHSWFARGVKPASQADGWWDEAFTTFHDNGADDAVPFNFTNSPIVLCSLDPWQRTTPDNAYSDGNDFWKGMAALTGVGTLNSVMSNFYTTYTGNLATTPMIEEYLVCKAGKVQTVDAFHRFVYGFPNPSPAPELWLKDDDAHTGTDQWDGAFWDSPDLWIRNTDDGGTTHEAPEYGQDNWFYARIRNKNSAGTAKHFVVTFNAKSFAGTEFIYPDDFLPCIAAKAEFELAPGQTRIVKAKWPRNLVPPAGTHSCLLASVISRSDHPGNGLHVWEHNNLAQKNLTIVNLDPDMFIIIPFVAINLFRQWGDRHQLEVWRDKKFPAYDVSLVHRSKEFFDLAKKKAQPFFPVERLPQHDRREELLDCGGHLDHLQPQIKHELMTSKNPQLIARRFPEAYQSAFPKGEKAAIPITLTPQSPVMVGLKVSVPKDAKRGDVIKTHLVQRNTKTKKITGGIAVQITVK